MSNEQVSPEDEARKLVVELRLLEGTAESLQSRINFLNAAYTELSISNNTLEGLKDRESDAPLLVPIGGGSYIKAKLGKVDEVIYGVGAGVASEKALNEAKEGIENRMTELEKTRRSLEQQLSQVLRRMQNDQNRLQELSSELRIRERR